MKRNRGPKWPPHRNREGLGARLRALALSALLVASQVLGLFGSALGPETAYAATPVPDSVTISSVEAYSPGVGMFPSHKFVSDAGVVTYCADCNLGTPTVGQTFSGRVAGGLTLDYILFYGYGGAGYRGSVQGYTGEEAQAVTQLAVWFVLTEYTPASVYGRKLASAGQAFLAEAQANASADAGYAGTSWIYGQNTGSTQRVVGQTIRLFDPIWFVVQKVDSDGAQVSDWDAQGNATTEGAQFTIRFYEGVSADSVDQLPSSPTRTWVIQTKKGTNGKVRAALSDQYKVSGDDWYYDDNGVVSLPVGSFTVQETKAPEGYLMSDPDVHLGQVKASEDGYARVEKIGGWTSTFDQQDAGAGLAVADDVVRGGAKFSKVDAERDEAVPQGDATLSGAEITIRNDSANAVEVNGTWYQPGEDVLTLTTGEDGTAQTSTDALPYGTYTARETKASRGYLLNDKWSKTFSVTDQGAIADCTDSPVEQQVIRGGAIFGKIDAERDAAVPQGDATLAGAEITITNESAKAVQVNGTWYQPGEDVLTLTTGEDGTAQTAADALPYGSYTARETKASRGYLLNESWSRSFQVTEDGQMADCRNTPLPEDVIRGGASFLKVDAERDEAVPEGAATLAGATIAIRNDSARSVLVGGTWYQPGEDVLTLTTGEDGTAQTAADALPYGTYTARETSPSKGYLLNSSWSKTFTVSEQGAIADCTDSPVEQQVIRGDLSAVKAEEDSMARMAWVPFLVTSQTTGEWHVVVTDENGMINTSSDWNPHTQRTNASDAAYDPATGKVDDSKLDPAAGIWFSGNADDATPVDDSLGALPYDTYSVQELRSKANEGHSLVGFSVTVTRNGVNLHMGTVDEWTVAIGTTLTDAEGEKCVPASASTRLIDEVSYQGLTPGATYTLEGELHVVNADGTDGGTVATASTDFVPGTKIGTTEQAFDVDTTQLGGRSLVAFETVRDASGQEVASHADLSDQGQTVTVPAIHTTLQGDAGHESAATSHVTLTDTVEYSGLTPGKAYTATGTLHLVNADGTDGGVAKDADGKDVTASATFTPDSADGSVEVTFDFDAPDLSGKTVVAFEDVSHGDISYATHADITDEGQSVRFPSVHTTATADATGDHELPATSAQKVTDTVHMENLTTGHEYVVTGTLHVVADDGTDAGTLKDSDGNDVTATTTFTAEAATQDVTVAFDVDASGLAGKRVVAFEDLSTAGVSIATHADITDEGQTLHVPAIHTTATDEGSMHEHQLTDADSQMAITDTVSYEGLTPGTEYVATGTLHLVNADGTDGGTVKDADGKDVTASATFTPEASDGTVEVQFTFDATQLAGRTVVAFEDVSRDGVTVATHADVTDEGQSVHFIDIHTTATDKADGDHEITAAQTQTVVDRVEYTNLVPGKEYTITGTLHLVNEDGTDAGVLSDASGNKVTATKTFTPETPDGYVDVGFTFDATGLAGRKVVAFEDLSTAGVSVATHADITDEGQTVTVATPETGNPQGGSSSYPNTGQGPVAAVLIAAGLTAVCAAGIRGALRRRKTADESESK
ncbi:VaFE repeat-containing surface-anchored protein [Tractidigestivibacter sp.]|uniref:VaFE repeat-containing surface-anchored protein n=1 Tax=Tractidigestivibacter sp. TaxID=2847320 RepID=UPI003AEF3E86